MPLQPANDSDTEEENANNLAIHDGELDSASDGDSPDFLYFIDINGREQPEEEVDEEANVILPNGGRIDSNVPMQNGWCCEEDFKFADVQPFSGIGIEGVKDIPPETNTPFKFWSLLITVQMILDIVKWTNEYARKWKDATIDQIYDPANPQNRKICFLKNRNGFFVENGKMFPNRK